MNRAPDPPNPPLGEEGRLFQSSDLEEAVSLLLAGGEVAVFTTKSPAGTDSNEDAAAVIASTPGSGLLAVADGFGGAPAGERAARIAIDELASHTLASRSDGTPLRASILDGFESANRKILELGIGAATTLVAVGVEGRSIRPFHSGDSSILVIGGRGKVKWESVAHSPAGYAVASGWVGEDEAREHDEAQVVSNYLGSSEMRIEVGPRLNLALRDTVLLASDGLTDNLPLEQVAGTLAQTRSLSSALEELARRARERMDAGTGKPDDLTLVAFRQLASALGG